MKTKTCRDCGIDKNLDNFYKGEAYKDGHLNRCKECEKLYRQARKEKAIAITKDWYDKNKDKQKEYKKEYFRNNKDKLLDYQKEYRKNNRNKVRLINNNYQRQRMSTDINYKLSKHLRSRLNKAIKNDYKAGSAINDLGCSIEELKKHLESQFQEGMSWDNYGEWHIDHIKPLANYNLTDKEQLKSACHYTNLQPLWAKDNLSKGNRDE